MNDEELSWRCRGERNQQFLLGTKKCSLSPLPMTDKFQYRAVQHNGLKRFDDEPRVLTYRGATYQTRVFEVRYEALPAR